jgi:hypothetical protein
MIVHLLAHGCRFLLSCYRQLGARPKSTSNPPQLRHCRFCYTEVFASSYGFVLQSVPVKGTCADFRISITSDVFSLPAGKN